MRAPAGRATLTGWLLPGQRAKGEAGEADRALLGPQLGIHAHPRQPVEGAGQQVDGRVGLVLDERQGIPPRAQRWSRAAAGASTSFTTSRGGSR